MSDSPETKKQEKKSEGDNLTDTALELLKSGYKKVKESVTSLLDGPELEKKGALPIFKLDGLEAYGKDGKVAKSESMVDVRHDAKLVHNQDEFLKRYPQLVLSESDWERQQGEFIDRTSRLAQNKKTLEELTKKNDQLMKDLIADGVKVFPNGGIDQGQFKKLSLEKQTEYNKRNAELWESNGIKVESKITTLEKSIEAEERSLRLLGEKLDFQADLKRIDKISPQEKKEAIYKSLEVILNNDTKQTTNLTKEQRQELVLDIVHQIAHPEDVKQGNKGTCALADVEFTLAKNHPDVYARAVAELAIKGELETFHGAQGKIEGSKIDPKQDIQDDDGNPERSLASKLMQTSLAKLAMSKEGKRYLNFHPDVAPAFSDGRKEDNDSGERIQGKDGKILKWDGLSCEDEVKLLNDLTGAKYKSEELPIDSPETLAAIIENEAERHGYPISITVSYPTAGDNGAHVITVTGVDRSKVPPEVIYQDSAQPRGESQIRSIDVFFVDALIGDGIFKDPNDPQGVRGTPLFGDSIRNPRIEIIHK